MPGISRTPTEVINDIAMSTFPIFLLLEGAKDALFFEGRPFPSRVESVVLFGWENVKQALQNACERGLEEKIIALFDRDYRQISGIADVRSISKRAVVTDMHSLESTLFWSDAFNKVLHEYGSSDKLRRANDFSSIRNEIASCCIKLGKYRAYCCKNGIPVDFADATHKKFITKNPLAIDKEKFLNHLRGLKDNCQFVKDADWIASQETQFSSPYSATEHICHGHDLMECFAIALQSRYGTLPGTFDGACTEKLFRISYESAWLDHTQMWRTICSFFPQDI